MRILTRKKQRKVVLHLIALQRILDDLIDKLGFENIEDVLEYTEYTVNNICEIAYIIDGVKAMKAVEKYGLMKEEVKKDGRSGGNR